jgi:hypothetical protein
MINEQAAYLPAMYDLKSQKEHQDRMFGLSEQGLAADVAYQNRMADISEKNLKTSRNLGYANLALSTGLGLAQYADLPDTGDTGLVESIGTGAKKIAGDVWESLGDVYDWASDLFI